MIWLSFIKKNYALIIILILTAIIALQQCNTTENKNSGDIVKIDGKKYEVIKHEIDTEYVKVTQTVVKKGEDIVHDVPVYVNVPVNVDTAAILKDYYAKYCVKDTLKLKDSLGWVSVKDTLYKNKIVYRLWNSDIHKTVIRETTIVKELPKNQLYVGDMIGLQWPNKTLVVGPSIMLKTKKDQLYGVYGGLSFNSAPYVGVSSLWKIYPKKNK